MQCKALDISQSSSSVVDKLLPKLKSSMRPSSIAGYLNNAVSITNNGNNNYNSNSNHNNSNNNNNGNNSFIITSDNCTEFVECEEKCIFAIKVYSSKGKWRAYCICCHTFGATNHTWTIDKEMTTGQASNHKFFWDQVGSIRNHVTTQSHRTNMFKLRKQQTKENSCLLLKADIAQFMQRHSLPAILFEDILLLFFKEKNRSKCSFKDICVIGDYQDGSTTPRKWNDISQKYLNKMLTIAITSCNVTAFNLVFFSGSMDGWSTGNNQSQKCYLLQLSEYTYGEEKENNVKDTASCVQLFFDACKTVNIFTSSIDNEMDLYDGKPIVIFRNFCTDGSYRQKIDSATGKPALDTCISDIIPITPFLDESVWDHQHLRELSYKDAEKENDNITQTKKLMKNGVKILKQPKMFKINYNIEKRMTGCQLFS